MKQKRINALMAFVAGVLAVPFSHAETDLLFHASFDHSLNAEVAKGGGAPIRAVGVEFAPGHAGGRAVRATCANRTTLEYAFPGNVVLERGTVTAWVKREWPKAGDVRAHWAMIFSVKFPPERLGSGALMFWHWGDSLRLDVSDASESFITHEAGPADGQWEHVAFVWDGVDTRIGLNGRLFRGAPGNVVATGARNKTDVTEFFGKRGTFSGFFVGNRDGIRQFDGLIDDLRVYSEPLSDDRIRELFEQSATQEEKGAAASEAPPDYAKLFAGQATNRYEGGDSLSLSLVEAVELDEPGVKRLKAADRFAEIGSPRTGSLGGVPYREAGTAMHDRFAVRFRLDPSVPLHCIEIDYPDDKVRTMDLVVQESMQEVWDGTVGADYTLQVGVMTGDLYPNSGRILTHRCVYWTRGADVTLMAMTARQDMPAAISAIRVYKVDDGRLPPLAVRNPRPVDGWRRQIAFYFEDPALGYDLAVPGDGYSPGSLSEEIDRCAALMKYTGETLLIYPGAWYDGFMDDNYNPRHHAPAYRRAWYEKFDREGLGFMPMVQVFNVRYAGDRPVTWRTMRDGSLHATEVSIQSTGMPNEIGIGGTPPNFNFFHPRIRRYLEDVVHAFVDEGKAHPSFKGVCLHLARHTIMSWGTGEAGYNDYCIDAFEKETGIKVPCDRSDPLRGKAYHDWLRANAWDAWLGWRCRYFAEFWGGIARRMAEARPDLRLCLNTFGWAPNGHPGYTDPDITAKLTRESGLDVELLQAAAPNIIVMQSVPPSAYRLFTPNQFPASNRAERVRCNREFCRAEKTYAVLGKAKYPFVGQHDFYWEDPIGASKDKSLTLDRPWLRECRWRVTTMNPPDRHALMHFVLPLRYHDVLGVSKGGFLVGTYGMEGPLREFAAAFRALPAVVFDTVPRADGCRDVVLRWKRHGGKTWIYLVNTTDHRAKASVRLPPGTKDAVADEPAESGDFTLEPYRMRSFVAPGGRPEWK